MDVVRSLVGETNSTVWDGISAVLGGMYVLLEHIGGSPFSHYKAFGKDIVLQALGRVGWDSKIEDDHSAKLLRTTVIALLHMFASDEEAVLKEARRRFDGHFTGIKVYIHHHHVHYHHHYYYLIHHYHHYHHHLHHYHHHYQHRYYHHHHHHHYHYPCRSIIAAFRI
jgi:hypothetical protein